MFVRSTIIERRVISIVARPLLSARDVQRQDLPRHAGMRRLAEDPQCAGAAPDLRLESLGRRAFGQPCLKSRTRLLRVQHAYRRMHQESYARLSVLVLLLHKLVVSGPSTELRRQGFLKELIE